ncbi:MAG: histidine kinase dimerization/phosphoacceptor domain -containing protein [bacterium]
MYPGKEILKNGKSGTKRRAAACHLLIISGLLILSNYVYSQSYLVHTYTEYDGLPNSFVKDMAQDSSGRIWFATRGGIAVYDGSEWQTYTASNGLPNPDFRFIKVDGHGRVWALTRMAESVIWYFNGSEWLSILSPFESLRKRESVTSFELTSVNDRTVLAVGTRGYGLYIFSDNRWRQITEEDGLPSSSVNATASHDGHFYVATSEGLSRVRGEEIDNSLNRALNTPTLEIMGIAVESSSSWAGREPIVWLQGEGWIGYAEDGSFHLVSDSIKTPRTVSYFQPVLQPDSHGGLYWGSLADIFHIGRDDGAIRYLGPESGLIAMGATSMLLDRENNLWIAGLQGVSKIPSMRFANYSKENGLLEDEVTAVVEAEPGTMVLGHNCGLTFLNDGKICRYAFSEDRISTPKDARVMDLRKDTEGNVWAAATSLGVARIDKTGTITWYQREQGLQGQLFSVMVDSSRRAWAGGQQGLFTLEGEKFVSVKMEGLSRPRVRRVVEGPDRSIYLATISDGVYVRRDNRWKQYLDPQSKRNNSTYSILADSQGSVWVGSLGGLFSLANDTLTKFRAGNFQIDRPVYLIIEDSEGRLWFGTDNGVFRWDGLNARQYTVRQGLAGQETNRAAGFVDSQGRVWIGTDRGVSCYQEEFDCSYISPPIVELLHAEASGKEFPLQSSCKLKHNLNDLLFRFRVISFIDENDITIKARLEGLYQDWFVERRSHRRMISFANLNPGHYRFHLQARNAEGVWSEIVSSPEIFIRKPFWQQWWFYMISLSLIGLTGYSIQRYFAERRYSSRLEKEVNERTKELRLSKERLRASLGEKEVLLKEIHHRVKNNLQVISSLLNLQSDHIKDKQIRELFKDSQDRVHSMALIHETLYRSNDLTRIDFGEYVRDLTGYLFRSYRVDPKLIGLKIDAENVFLDTGTVISCGLIINELVANALKHAFPDGNKGKIIVDLHPNKTKQLTLTVRDNGVGFPEELDFRNTDSLGLQLVNMLVEQLEGNIELQKKGGTKFMITFGGDRYLFRRS